MVHFFTRFLNNDSIKIFSNSFNLILFFPVCLTISSDEEESDSSKKQCSQNGIGSEENVVTEVRKKEPNITEETESPEEAMTRGVAGWVPFHFIKLPFKN